jgi:mRNA-degrading endonuclease toxin of MazEF toxin-antitoxin module
MVHGRGEVWWGPAPQKSGPAYRPWVVVSESTHPFGETECIALAMTTQQHTAGIAVPDSAWIRGGAKKDSYISPWYVATIKYADFDRQQGKIESELVADAGKELHRYTTPSSAE